MFALLKIRWPYREDKIFSVLSFIVLVVPIIFSLFTNENFETIKFSLWLIFAGWALFLLVRQHKKNYSGKFGINLNLGSRLLALAFGGLFFFGFFSAILAPDKLYSFFGFYYRFTNSLLFTLLWVLTVVLLLNVLDNAKWIFLLKLLSFDALLVAIKAIFESLGYGLYQGNVSPGFFHSPSLLGNPNFSSMFMACLLPFMVVFWKENKKFWEQLCYGVGIFIILLSLFVLASRGTILALLLGGLFLCLAAFFIKARTRLLKQWVIVCLALALFSVMVIQVSRPSVLHLDFSDQNVVFRLQVWKQSWQEILRRPVLGVGLGNFALFHEHSVRPPEMGTFDDPHNLFLFLAATGGLPFFAGFMIILLSIAFFAFKTLQKTGDLMLLAALTGLVIFIVAAAFTPVSVPNFLLLAVLLAGLAVRSGRNFNFNFRFGRIALPVSACLFIFCGLSLVLGDSFLHFGYGRLQEGRFSGAARLLHIAERINPTNQLAAINAIAADIELKRDPALVEQEINYLTAMHKTQAGTWSAASNLHYSLFKIFGKTESLDAAIADLKKAVSLDRYLPERYEELGYYYYLQKNFSKALEFLNYGLSLKSNAPSVSSYILEAKIYQLEHNRDLMLKAIDQAFKLDPLNIRLRYLLYIIKKEPDADKIPLDVILAQNNG